MTTLNVVGGTMRLMIHESIIVLLAPWIGDYGPISPKLCLIFGVKLNVILMTNWIRSCETSNIKRVLKVKSKVNKGIRY